MLIPFGATEFYLVSLLSIPSVIRVDMLAVRSYDLVPWDVVRWLATVIVAMVLSSYIGGRLFGVGNK